MKNIYAVCYNTLYVFKDKELARYHFIDCASCSEGAERDRYVNILMGFEFGNIGVDSEENEINKIVMYDETNRVVEKIETNWQNYENVIKELEAY